MIHTITNDETCQQIDKMFDDYFEEYKKLFPEKPHARVLGWLNFETGIFTPNNK